MLVNQIFLALRSSISREWSVVLYTTDINNTGLKGIEGIEQGSGSLRNGTLSSSVPGSVGFELMSNANAIKSTNLLPLNVSVRDGLNLFPDECC